MKQKQLQYPGSSGVSEPEAVPTAELLLSWLDARDTASTARGLAAQRGLLRRGIVIRATSARGGER